MVNAQTLIARIFANIAVWGFMVYGLFFLAAYKDYTMGFNLSVLTACKCSLPDSLQKRWQPPNPSCTSYSMATLGEFGTLPLTNEPYIV